MRAKELEDLKLVDLKKVAKSLNVPQIYKMNKLQLFNRLYAILTGIELVAEKRTVKVDTKKRYRENATPGTLVAFRVHGKLMTAKIVNVNERAHNTDLEVHTKNGTKFHVNVLDVLWFKTGMRWPKSIFDELKGIASVKK